MTPMQRHGARARASASRRALSAAAFALAALACAGLWRLPPRGEETKAPSTIDSIYEAKGLALLYAAPREIDAVARRMPLASVIDALETQARLRLPLALLTAAAGGLLAVSAAVMIVTEAPLWMAGALALLALVGAAPWTMAASLEGLYAVTLLGVLALMLLRERRRGWVTAAALAAGIGASLMVRSPLALLPVLLMAIEARRAGSRGEYGQAALIGLGSYLPLAPWIWMNWTLSGRFIPFEDGGASMNIITGALGLVLCVEGDWTTLVDGPLPEGLGAVLAWAAGTAARHPLDFASGVLGRLAFAARQAPILALAAVPAVWAAARRPALRTALILPSYYIGLHCLMSIQDRYLTPIWPVLLVTVAAGAAAVSASLAPATRGEAPPWAERVAKLWGAAALSLGVWMALLIFGLVGASRLGTLEALTRALERRPGQAWLLAERGAAHIAAGRLEDAEKDLAAAVARAPSADNRLWLARVQALRGRPDALLALDLHDDPYDSDVSYAAFRANVYQTSALLGLGRNAEARVRLKAALESSVFRPRIRSSSSRDHAAFDKLAASPAVGLIALGLLRDQPQERARLARALEHFMPVPEDAYRMPAPTAPPAPASRAPQDSLDAIFKRADEAHARADPGASAAALRKVERLAASDRKSLRRAAFGHQRLGGYAEARRVFEDIAKRWPSAQAQTDLGICRFLAGDAAGAESALREATLLDAGFLDAYSDLAGVLDSLGRLEDALAVTKSAPASGGTPTARRRLEKTRAALEAKP